LLLFTFFQVSGQKTYFKDYNGKLKSEGWVNQNKSGLLFYYFENGNKKEEGLYKEQNANGGFLLF
jgi:antitoxin component YwqK of YwqJK toxin-antitoxin module